MLKQQYTAGAPTAYFNRSQVVKAVNLEAGTYAVNRNGSFFNEPPFPGYDEAHCLLSSLEYPISDPIDISFMIAYGAGIIEQQGTSHSGQGQ